MARAGPVEKGPSSQASRAVLDQKKSLVPKGTPWCTAFPNSLFLNANKWGKSSVLQFLQAQKIFRVGTSNQVLTGGVRPHR